MHLKLHITISRWCSCIPQVCPTQDGSHCHVHCPMLQMPLICCSLISVITADNRAITGPYTVLPVLATASGIFWEMWDIGLCIKVDDSKGIGVEFPEGALQGWEPNGHCYPARMMLENCSPLLWGDLGTSRWEMLAWSRAAQLIILFWEDRSVYEHNV